MDIENGAPHVKIMKKDNKLNDDSDIYPTHSLEYDTSQSFSSTKFDSPNVDENDHMLVNDINMAMPVFPMYKTSDVDKINTKLLSVQNDEDDIYDGGSSKAENEDENEDENRKSEEEEEEEKDSIAYDNSRADTFIGNPDSASMFDSKICQPLHSQPHQADQARDRGDLTVDDIQDLNRALYGITGTNRNILAGINYTRAQIVLILLVQVIICVLLMLILWKMVYGVTNCKFPKL